MVKSQCVTVKSQYSMIMFFHNHNVYVWWVNPNINGHAQYYPEKNETYWKAGFCEAEWITYLNASDWSYLSPICDGITMGKPVTTLMNLWNLMNLTKFVEVQWSAYVSIVGQHSIFCQRSAGCGLPLATMVPSQARDAAKRKWFRLRGKRCAPIWANSTYYEFILFSHY